MAGNIAPGIRDARQILVERRRELDAELRQLKSAIAALDEVTQSGATPGRQRRFGIQPAVESVLREAGRTMHADEATEAVASRIEGTGTATVSKASVVSALHRLVKIHKAEAYGGNFFEWIEPESANGARPSEPLPAEPQGAAVSDHSPEGG